MDDGKIEGVSTVNYDVENYNVIIKRRIGQSVPLLHGRSSQVFWQHIRKEREWRSHFQWPQPLGHPSC
jgi:hypothetical protein